MRKCMDGKVSGLELTEPSTCSPPHEQTYIIEGKSACAPASKAMTSDTGSEQVCIVVTHCKSALPVVQIPMPSCLTGLLNP